MKRFVFPIVLAAAAVPAIVFASARQASPAAGRHVFTVVAQDSAASVTPPDFMDRLSQNLQAAEDEPVYRDGKKAGLAETIITVTRADGDDFAAIIACSIELPNGNILFNGSAHLADLGTGATLPVVGGTGTYAGARGTVTMTVAADGTSTTLDFDFSTP